MKGILRSSFYITLGMFLGRSLGLVRDLLVSAQWGTTEFADMVLLLLNFPDMLPNMLVGGGVTALLVPRLVKADSNETNRLYSLSFYSLTIYGTVVAIASFVFADSLASWMAPGFSDAAKAQTAVGVKIFSVSVALMFIAFLPRGFLQGKENFKANSLENVFFNLPLIIGLIVFRKAESLNLICISVVFASVIRVLYMHVSCTMMGARLRAVKLSWSNEIFLRFFSVVLTTGCVIFLTFLLRALATNQGPGNLSIFMYFYKFLELPFGILTTIVFSIALPKLSAKTHANYGHHLLVLLKWSALGGIAASGALYVLSGFALPLLKFTAADIEALLLLLAIGSLALPARLALSYLQSVEYSRRGTSQSFVANVTGLVATGIFLWLFRSQLTLPILAWALNVYYVTATATLYTQLRGTHFKMGKSPVSNS